LIMTNLYFASPETRVFHEHSGRGSYIDNVVAQLEGIQQPFFVVNGSGNRHHDTAQLIRTFNGDLTYVHLDHHTDIGNFGKLTPNKRHKASVDKLLRKAHSGHIPDLLGYFKERGEPASQFEPTIDECGTFVRDIGSLDCMKQIVILGEGQATSGDMGIYREILAKTLMYSSKSGEREVYYNCTPEDIEMLNNNPSVADVRVIGPPVSTTLRPKDMEELWYQMMFFNPFKPAVYVTRHDVSVFMEQMSGTGGSIISTDRVYMSGDLDVLTSGIVTDFTRREDRELNQGHLSLDDYLKLVNSVFAHKTVVSGDVCGISEKFAQGNRAEQIRKTLSINVMQTHDGTGIEDIYDDLLGYDSHMFDSTQQALAKIVDNFLENMQKQARREAG